VVNLTSGVGPRENRDRRPTLQRRLGGWRRGSGWSLAWRTPLLNRVSWTLPWCNRGLRRRARRVELDGCGRKPWRGRGRTGRTKQGRRRSTLRHTGGLKSPSQRASKPGQPWQARNTSATSPTLRGGTRGGSNRRVSHLQPKNYTQTPDEPHRGPERGETTKTNRVRKRGGEGQITHAPAAEVGDGGPLVGLHLLQHRLGEPRDDLRGSAALRNKAARGGIVTHHKAPVAQEQVQTFPRDPALTKLCRGARKAQPRNLQQLPGTEARKLGDERASRRRRR